MKINKTYVCDFETTVFKGQTYTEVWASGCCELFKDDVMIFTSIKEQMDYFINLKSNLICYFHNLKFDGSFILSYLMLETDFKCDISIDYENVNNTRFAEPKQLRNNHYIYSISEMGQWYKIILKVNHKTIEFRDSLKLLPFSLDRIGKSFHTKHQKLEMEYTGFRYAGCKITPEETEYLKNDVYVLKEVMEIMYQRGHKKLTIGSCCLHEYKQSIGDSYDKYHPNLYHIPIDSSKYCVETAGDYIRNSYRGGWCYLVKGKENKIYNKGTTADVNSLYPSMMSSESGNRYPVGEPKFWKGDRLPCGENLYYFVRIKTKFYIKKDKLPFIQIKNSPLYKSNEALTTSDVLNLEDNKYYPYYYDFQKNLKEAFVTLTLTMTDFKLLQEHYHLVDCTILDGCYFRTEIGIFDSYIEKYKKIKMMSKGAERELAKLFLNNLYGKMASSEDSSFKVARVKDDLSLGFFSVKCNEKEAGYIAIGSAITSYARNFTIRAAQQNYYGVNERGFIYADTDSIHCDLSPAEIKGINVHNTQFCHWSLECEWEQGYYVRQKTYMEEISKIDGEPVENKFFKITCAGMPAKCKNLFLKSMSGYNLDLTDKYNEEERKFLQIKREITDFTIGLCVPSKLMPKRIKGGVLLVDDNYTMR